MAMEPGGRTGGERGGENRREVTGLSVKLTLSSC